MNSQEDQILGGPGTCSKCGKHVSNRSFRETNCEQAAPKAIAITERAPEFPCWLWTNVRTGDYRWVSYGHEGDGHFVAKHFDQLPNFAKAAATHWHSDQPTAPLLAPTPEPLTYNEPHQYEKDLAWLLAHSGNSIEETVKAIVKLNAQHASPSPVGTQAGGVEAARKRVEAQITVLDALLTGYASYPDSKEVVPAAFAHELARELSAIQPFLAVEDGKEELITALEAMIKDCERVQLLAHGYPCGPDILRDHPITIARAALAAARHGSHATTTERGQG